MLKSKAKTKGSMDMPDISIIMPIYNVEDHLERAIQSALNQTSENWELILVDDGSTDNSGQIADKYEGKHRGQITVIHQNNQGSGMARNTGLEEAVGDYVYFADPDDYFDRTLIEENLEFAQKYDSDIVVFGYEIENDKGSVKDTKLPNIPQLPTQKEVRKHFRNFYYSSPYSLWNKLYKASFLREHNLQFTEQKLGQDALFNIEVFKYLDSVSVNRQVYYHYIEYPSSAVRQFRSDRFELELTIAKHFEQLMDQWKMKNEFVDLITKEYWNALYLELATVASTKSPLSKDEKRMRMELALENERIKLYFNDWLLEFVSNTFQRKLIQSLLKDDINKAIRLMRFRNQVEAHSNKLFQIIRKPFK